MRAPKLVWTSGEMEAGGSCTTYPVLRDLPKEPAAATRLASAVWQLLYIPYFGRLRAVGLIVQAALQIPGASVASYTPLARKTNGKQYIARERGSCGPIPPTPFLSEIITIWRASLDVYRPSQKHPPTTCVPRIHTPAEREFLVLPSHATCRRPLQTTSSQILTDRSN
jgi:hypothetical protein